ncbi:AraC family transcriptional regulator [Pararobbsia alpina]|uniref:RCS-specific HTH-type transcriptional activator RclR n=1 Tax=Pararobbsia alpina TaxID=621374 RepID=A0A6S7CEN0_9BURK|nr:AraC family transcriptional regulator [Pararobbsia alpina]CAB3787860.1 RCS-specific HTH-type transcriptional activator RclR [Pararobbsia alpina]
MFSTRNSYADRLNEQDGAHFGSPPTPDSLSAISPLLRVRPELQEVCRFTSQWKTVHEAESPGWAQFHIVTKGSCCLELQGGKCFQLEAGNLLLLPHGDAHVVRSNRRGRSTGVPIQLECNDAITIKTNTDDESDTELICGRLHFEEVPTSLVIAALPKMMLLSLGTEQLLGHLRILVQMIDEELEAARPGAAAVATDLASALFVIMLRTHFEQAESASDLIRLLATRASARAVNAMLNDPAHGWTLEELAAESHVSRATLVRTFQKAAGMAPLAFLTELRLGLARQSLTATNAPLMKVAMAVGYDSESAFARAFRRRFGISPGKLRGIHQKRAD